MMSLENLTSLDYHGNFAIISLIYSLQKIEAAPVIMSRNLRKNTLDSMKSFETLN